MMFPADAGMNRSMILNFPVLVYVPRRRGDEPDFTVAMVQAAGCSPQTRG